MQEKGHISINAENILPIIKKWLYSEKEIFLRELVSNASDAIAKLSKLDLMGEVEGGAPEARIDISVNNAKKLIIIKDSGLGMDKDEIKKYINQVAFSGVSDFIEKYKDKDTKNQVIGHFGLGFYSAFMVADKVEIDSLSYKKDAKPIHWSCDGSTDFEISSSDKKDIGTTITLHISNDDESQKMLNISKLKGILNKYCAFMRYPIRIDDKIINDPSPIWNQNPSKLQDKDYISLFNKLFPTSHHPLFWLHINLDYPFKLNGVLYFPQLKHELNTSQGGIKLYSNQVFIEDNAKEMLPEHLTVLKGVLDVADIPLNVSRSSLQNDDKVRKISKYIIKKVADKLIGVFKTERQNYNKFWDDINPFIKFAIMRDNNFADRMLPYVIFKSISGDYITLDDYLKKIGEKTDSTVIYVSNQDSQSSYINMFKEHGLDAIIADSVIDMHFMPFLEMSGGKGYKFKRIDADISKYLVDDKDSNKIIDPKDSQTENGKILEVFRENISRKKVKIRVEGLKTHIPAMLIFDENKRRLKEMTKFNTANYDFKLTEDEHTLIVNANNLAVKNLIDLIKNPSNKSKIKMIVDQIYDLAYLQHSNFDGEDMKSFIKRSSSLLENVSEGGQIIV